MNPTQIPDYLSLILTHPSKDSFSHHLWQTMVTEAEAHLPPNKVKSHHLDYMDFDPVITPVEFARHSALDSPTMDLEGELQNTRDLVLVFPLWWGMMPALLTGYIQRVFAAEVAYTIETQATGLLSKLRIHLVICADTPQPKDVHPLQDVVRYDIGEFCGASLGRTLWCGPLRTSTYQERQRWTEEAKKLITDLAQGQVPY